MAAAVMRVYVAPMFWKRLISHLHPRISQSLVSISQSLVSISQSLVSISHWQVPSLWCWEKVREYKIPGPKSEVSRLILPQKVPGFKKRYISGLGSSPRQSRYIYSLSEARAVYHQMGLATVKSMTIVTAYCTVLVFFIGKHVDAIFFDGLV